jgi:hypothetical protein
LQRLSVGGQATLYTAKTEATADEALPQGLIIKVYHPWWPDLESVVQDEMACLSRLRSLLHGRTIEGWQLHVPTVLYRSRQPHAIVMSSVPGRSVAWHLKTAGVLDRLLWESVSRAAIGALEEFWADGCSLYGDLNFHNLLCDPASRQLSFVDPGKPDEAWLCPGVARQWFPASRDLAYLLYSVASAVRSTLGKPGYRRRQVWLAEHALRVVLNQHTSADRAALLDEIEACARLHLATIEVSRSLAGCWRAFVRRSAAETLASMLHRLRAGETSQVQTDCAPVAQEVSR